MAEENPRLPSPEEKEGKLLPVVRKKKFRCFNRRHEQKREGAPGQPRGGGGSDLPHATFTHERKERKRSLS